MAIIIVDTGTATFTMNGVTYLKNFQSLVINNSIKIVNAYDSKMILLSNTNYADFTVDGNTFANVLLLQQDLVSKLFNRPATGAGLIETSLSSTMFFHNTAGVRHGTWTTPITGTLTIDPSGAVEGGTVVVIWSGSSNPTIVGGIIQSYGGDITINGIYSIYIHYLNGRYNVNIFNSENPGTGGDVIAPATMSINNIIKSGDLTPPATMEILSIGGDNTPPATMEITSII